MTDFKPYQDDSAVVTIGDLSIENGAGTIVVHGDVEIPRDRHGLERAQALLAAIGAIVETLKADGDALPASIGEDASSTTTFTNPFA